MEQAQKQALIDNDNLEKGAKEVMIHGKKIRDRGTNEHKKEAAGPSISYKDPVPIDKRKVGRSGSKLSLSEKINIVHQAVCLKILYQDIAKEHRISGCYVSQIIKRALKNPKFITEMMSKRQESEEHRESLQKAILKMN